MHSTMSMPNLALRSPKSVPVCNRHVARPNQSDHVGSRPKRRACCSPRHRCIPQRRCRTQATGEGPELKSVDKDAAGSGRASQNGTSSSSPDASSPPAGLEREGEDSDQILRQAFDSTKNDIISLLGLSQEASNALKSLTYDEVLKPDEVINRVAEELLGPVMGIIGLEESAYDFLIDVLKIGVFLQLLSVGALFYVTQLALHLDAGEALRCAGALQLGYTMRPLLSVERLLWPLYDDFLQMLLNDPEANYGAPRATLKEMQHTINTLGLLVGAGFLLPQFLWHWSVHDSVQLVVPMASGWFMCDIWLILAVLVKLDVRK